MIKKYCVRDSFQVVGTVLVVADRMQYEANVQSSSFWIWASCQAVGGCYSWQWATNLDNLSRFAAAYWTSKAAWLSRYRKCVTDSCLSGSFPNVKCSAVVLIWMCKVQSHVLQYLERLMICRMFSGLYDVSIAPSCLVSSQSRGNSSYCTLVWAVARKCPSCAGVQPSNDAVRHSVSCCRVWLAHSSGDL